MTLADFRGRPVILAFYPADWSPVCGDQMALYNEVLPEFQRSARSSSASRSTAPGATWRSRSDRKLHFPLLADFEPKGEVAQALRRLSTTTTAMSERALFVHRRRRRDPLELRLADRRQSRAPTASSTALESMAAQRPSA